MPHPFFLGPLVLKFNNLCPPPSPGISNCTFLDYSYGTLSPTHIHTDIGANLTGMLSMATSHPFTKHHPLDYTRSTPGGTRLKFLLIYKSCCVCIQYPDYNEFLHDTHGIVQIKSLGVLCGRYYKVYTLESVFITEVSTFLGG